MLKVKLLSLKSRKKFLEKLRKLKGKVKNLNKVARNLHNHQKKDKLQKLKVKRLNNSQSNNKELKRMNHKVIMSNNHYHQNQLRNVLKI